MVVTGLEKILTEPPLLEKAGRLGLLYNQASVDRHFRSAPEMIKRAFPDRLTVLFGPQHGASGTEQDNMKETGHSIHPSLKLPVFSLYSASRMPSEEMLRDVDTILVDLQDVGTRVYTFATTVVYLMEVCAAAGKSVVILDRPNPVNGIDVEGNVLDPSYVSFVGPYPIPMRHGMTLGELMALYNSVPLNRMPARGHHAERVGSGRLFRSNGASLGLALAEHATGGNSRGLSRTGNPGRDKSVGRAGNHKTLRDLRRSLCRSFGSHGQPGS